MAPKVVRVREGSTKTLISNLRAWVNRKYGQTDCFLTQFMTGCGNFGTYLRRIKKVDDDSYNYCGETNDSEHAVLK